MGTSLTNEQIRRLERVAKEVVICYDGDNAGVQATNRAIQLLQENSHFDLSIVSILKSWILMNMCGNMAQKLFKI